MSAEFPLTITVQELARWRAEARAFAVLDVREPWELEICRFDNCLSIPLQQVPTRVAELPSDRPLVVICHHGMRSYNAVSWLRRNGMATAVNLQGGIDAWARDIEPTMGVY